MGVCHVRAESIPDASKRNFLVMSPEDICLVVFRLGEEGGGCPANDPVANGGSDRLMTPAKMGGSLVYDSGVKGGGSWLIPQGRRGGAWLMTLEGIAENGGHAGLTT